MKRCTSSSSVICGADLRKGRQYQRRRRRSRVAARSVIGRRKKEITSLFPLPVKRLREKSGDAFFKAALTATAAPVPAQEGNRFCLSVPSCPEKNQNKDFLRRQGDLSPLAASVIDVSETPPPRPTEDTSLPPPTCAAVTFILSILYNIIIIFNYK